MRTYKELFKINLHTPLFIPMLNLYGCGAPICVYILSLYILLFTMASAVTNFH